MFGAPVGAPVVVGVGLSVVVMSSPIPQKLDPLLLSFGCWVSLYVDAITLRERVIFLFKLERVSNALF